MKSNIKLPQKGLCILWCIWAAVCIGCFLLPLPLLSRVFFVATVSNFFFFALYYGNIYNLPGIFGSVFLFQIACSQAKLTAVEQCDFSRATWLVLLTVLAVFYLTTLLLNHFLHLRRMDGGDKLELRIVPGTLLFLNIACLVIEMVVYILVYRKLGVLPLFDDTVRAETLPALVGNVGITFMVLPQFMVMLNMAYCIQRDRYWMCLFSVAYMGMILTVGARINIFIPVIVCLVLLLVAMKRYKKRFWKLFFVAALSCVITVVLMLGIPMLRTATYAPEDPGQSSLEAGGDYYVSIYSNAAQNQGQVNPDPNYGIKLPKSLLPVWVNFSTELYGFNNMVNTLEQTQDFQHGRCFLTGTLNFLFKNTVDKPNSVELSGISFITVCTFLMAPYHDFGLWGVALFVALFVAASLLLYRRMMRKNTLFSLLYYGYFCMIAIMFIFTNHVYTSTFIVNSILIALCCWVVSVDWKQKLFGHRRGRREQ